MDILWMPSLPSWECGLKFWRSRYRKEVIRVAPFVGVWIEINAGRSSKRQQESLPSWECGLKLIIWLSGKFRCCRSLRGSVDWNHILQHIMMTIIVAPFVGVWIEIKRRITELCMQKRRSLRGSVDWNYNNFYNSASDLPSLPSWECGLKWVFKSFSNFFVSSLPSWECGLK